MQCKDFEAVLEQEGLAPLPMAARSHLAECSSCQNLLADLSAVVFSARELPAEVDPPERLWVSLRAQMEAEGLIKQPVAVAPDKKRWWQDLSTLFKPRVLITAGAGFAIAFSAFLAIHKTSVKVTKSNSSAAVVAEIPAPAQPKDMQAISSAPVVTAPAPQVVASAKHRSNPAPAEAPTFKPSPSDNIYASTPVALQDAEQSLNGPSLRGSVEAEASLRENLRVINEVIAECQKHLKKYPNDTMAREYLASAYHQKAELLAAILDRGRSEQ